MVKNHLKTLSAPKTWNIKRKKNVFVTRPNPSGQAMKFTLSINMVFKDMLGYCKTTNEVKKVLQENNVLVDGKRVLDPREAIAFMGILNIAETKESFRITLDKKGKLQVKKIDNNESDVKPIVIKGKTVLSKDKIQLNMSDGRNIIIKKNDYKIGDALLIALPKQDIKEHIKLDKGTVIILTAGKQIGSTGIIDEIEGNKIKFIADDKAVHETKKVYAYPIGVKKASITV